jgi:hypothetical protein
LQSSASQLSAFQSELARSTRDIQSPGFGRADHRLAPFLDIAGHRTQIDDQPPSAAIMSGVVFKAAARRPSRTARIDAQSLLDKTRLGMNGGLRHA